MSAAQLGEVRRSSRVRRTTSLLLPEPAADTAARKKRKAKVGRKRLPAKRASVQKQLNIISKDCPAPKAVKAGNGGKVIKVKEEDDDDQPTVRQLSGPTRPLPQPRHSLNAQNGSQNGGSDADPRSKGIAKSVRYEDDDAEYYDDEETDEEDLKANVQNFLQMNFLETSTSSTKTSSTSTTSPTATTTSAKASTTASSGGSSSSDPQNTAPTAAPKPVSTLPQLKAKPKPKPKPKLKPKGPQIHRCEQCGLVFQTADILARHQLANRDRLDHASSSSSLLITDARGPLVLPTPTLNRDYGTLNRDVPPLEAFTGYLKPRMERVYSCDRCISIFPSPATLSVHRTALHIAPTKKREFLCVECSKVFNRQDYLLYHLKHVHQASEEELRGLPMKLPRHTQVFGNENGIFVPLPIINSFSSSLQAARPPMGVLPPLPPVRPPAIRPPPILSRSILPARQILPPPLPPQQILPPQPVFLQKAPPPPILPPPSSTPLQSPPVLLPQVFPPSVQSLSVVQPPPPPVVVAAGAVVQQQQQSSSQQPQQPTPSQQPPATTSSTTFELKTNLQPPIPIFSTEKVNAGTSTSSSFSTSSSSSSNSRHRTVPPIISDTKKVVREGRLGYPCTRCPLVLPAPSKLKEHMRSVHIGLREHRCPVCARAFGKKENLKRHFVLRHPTAKPYFAAQQCRYCPAAFPTRPALEAHWVAVHRLNNKLRCDQCEKTFSRNFRLQNHRRRHHHSPGAPEEAAAAAGAVKPFPCPFCECTYKQVSQLKMHLRIHSMEGGDGDEEETVDGPAEGQEGEEASMGRKKTKVEVKVEPVENGNNAEVLNAGDKEGEEGEGEGKEEEEEEEEEASEDTSDTDDTDDDDDDDDDDFVAEDDDDEEEEDEDDDCSDSTE